MRFKKILSLLLAMTMLFSCVGITAMAEETASSLTFDEIENAYLITSVEDFIKFRNDVNTGIDYAGQTVKLSESIDLSGEENWTPIGNGTRSSKTYTGNSFKGVFDGVNYIISGLNITSSGGEDAAIGLFGVVDGGTVKNLNLTDVNNNVTTSKLAGGAIGLMVEGATAENITVSGAVTGYDGVGGIVGRMIISGTITGCTNNASVTSSYGGIGGIVGKAYYEDNTNTELFSSITNCTNNGTITAPMYVGGIVGLARSNVTGCTNNGPVVGGTQTGGIVGQLISAGIVSDNENKAKITGKNHMGGIIGDYTQSSDYSYYDVTIKDNINSGELVATEQCAAIMGCNNIDGFTGMTASGNVSYYNAEGLNLFDNPEDMVIDDTNKFVVVVAKIGDNVYATLDEALTEASTMSGDVVVEIYDKVTLNKSLAGNYSSITFAGMTYDAEIYLEVQGYITATGKNVAFENLKLSKSTGSFITNAGFMNVAFGVYDVNSVSYTDCTFLNGAYASSGENTFTGCTFYRSHDKYGLWAYGNVDCTVDGCTFADYRGIKMYAEGAAKTVDLTVKNTNFSAVTDKPAIVLTYGESVTLENNTYSSTGVFELDKDGSPNGTPVTSTDEITCVNDDGACGVLVDGKIYTTVVQAAAVATEGSTVTLLHDSTETVELAEGVILDKNGFTADGVTVKVTAVAQIGDNTYATLAAAIAEVQEGETIKLLADAHIAEDTDVTLPAGITLNGNGFSILSSGADHDTTTSYGYVIAGGNLTIEGITKIEKFSAGYYDRTITIGEGASLDVFGKNRVTLAYGNVFNITGAISDAKTADKAETLASLIIPAGISITGANDAAMNVKNAYVSIGSTTTKNSSTSGTIKLNFENSIAEFTNQLTFSEPTNGMNPTFNVNVKDSVLTTATKLCIAAPNTTMVVDNSTVNLGSYIRNSGELTLKNGSTLTGSTIQFGENGGNDGTIIVDRSVLTVNASSEGHAFDGKGEGLIVVKNGSTATITYLKDSYYDVDSTSTLNATLIGCTEYKVSVAEINGVGYETLQAALDAVENGEIITLLQNVTVTTPAYGENALNYAKAVNCTIDLGGYTVSADTGNSVFRFNISGTGAMENVIVTLKNGEVISGDNTWCAITATGMSENVKMILNLENVDVKNSRGYDFGVKSWANAVVNAKDVNVEATKQAGGFYAVGGEIVLDNCTVIQEGLYSSPWTSMAFGVSGGGKLTVNSGEYSAKPTSAEEGNGQGTTHGSWTGGVMNSGGTLIINGGTFTNGNFGDVAATAPRGVIVVDAGANLEINGGTFNGMAQIIDYTNNLGDASKNPVVTIKGGTYSANPESNWVKLPDSYSALPDLNGNYIVGVKPTATVDNLGSTIVRAGDYYNYGGGGNAVDMPLSFVMQFVADETAEAGAVSPYAEWYADFTISVTGLKDGYFVADGCYLAGNYGSFGWWKVPIDGLKVEDGVVYPVMLSVANGAQLYEYICSGVENFKCAMYLTPEVLEANPDLKVTLSLVLVDSSKGADGAIEAITTEENCYVVEKTTYDNEEFMIEYVAEINGVKYLSLEDALAAAEAGDTVTIFAGNYTGNLSINKDITVVGETDAEGNNLVNISGKLSITADGATVKNINIDNGGSSAGYISAKDVTVEGCSVVGGNGFRYCYTSGTVTFKDSVITGSTYGIHFDGSAGGNIVIDNCTITGWTSFASEIEKVTISKTEFAKGNYNQLRFYQNVEISDSKFNPDMTVDFGKDNVKLDITNCTVTDNSPITDVIYLGDIATMGVEVTVDGVAIVVEASVLGAGETEAKYYLTLEDAIAAANAGDTITLLGNIAITNTITIAADKTITLDLAGYTITGAPAESAAYAVITNKGNLTVEDSVGGGKILCDHQLTGSTSYAVNTITNAGTLTVNGGVIENTSTASNQIGYAIDNNSTTGNAVVTVNGGEIKASGSNYYDGIRQFCNSTTLENSVIVNDGSVSSIWMQNPSDGASDKNTEDVKGSVTVNGGTVTALYLEPSASFEAAVTGGNIGTLAHFQKSEGRDLAGFVSGGTFATKPADEFAAEGFEFVQNDNGTYGVEEIKLFEFSQMNLDLENSIKVNYYIRAEYFEGTDYYAEIVHSSANGDITEIVAFADWEDNNIYKQISYTGLVAKNMADIMTITIYDGNGRQVSVAQDASIKKYAESYLKNNASEGNAWITAMVDMLNYGAEAQKYFGYNVENLANADIDEYQKYATQNDVELENIASVFGPVYQANLDLENRIVYNGYFKNVTSDMTAKVSYTSHTGEKVEYDASIVKSGSYHKVAVNTLVIADANQLITITVYDGNGDVYAYIKDTVNSYLFRAMPDNSNFESLARAMAKFTAAAYTALQ